jgi:hypothetical protein
MYFLINQLILLAGFYKMDKIETYKPKAINVQKLHLFLKKIENESTKFPAHKGGHIRRSSVSNKNK